MSIYEDNVLEMEIIDDTEIFDSEIDFNGEYIVNVPQYQIVQAIEEYFKQNNITPKSKMTQVTLFGNKWVLVNERRYEQIIDVEGVTETSQVNLAPSDTQLDLFYDKKVVLSTKNIDGVVTVTLIGEKLEDDYTMQVILAEVDYE